MLLLVYVYSICTVYRVILSSAYCTVTECKKICGIRPHSDIVSGKNCTLLLVILMPQHCLLYYGYAAFVAMHK